MLHIGVSYRTELDEAVSVLVEVGAELRQDQQFAADLPEALQVVGVDDFTDTQLKLTLRIKTTPGKQWQVSRELRRRIKQAFDAHGIQMRDSPQSLHAGLDSGQRQGTDPSSSSGKRNA